MGLRGYQTEGLGHLAKKIIKGLLRILCVLPTGGGKTVMFSYMIGGYLKKSNKNVVILVHRDELLRQARQKLYHTQGIIAEIVQAGVKHWPPGRVHVCMVETAFKRMQKKPDWFKNVGMVVVDEAHLDNFSKTFPFFNDVIVVGFTATPVAANKKKPLNDFYQDIVVCCQIEELIQLWRDTDGNEGLCPCVTIAAKDAVDRKELKAARNEDGFDTEYMAGVYSTGKHIENTVDFYEKFAIGQKTLVFNCNKVHSMLQCEAFKSRGYNARHLDADATPAQRHDFLKWFNETPDAIGCNIGILTTGFDEPSVKWIIVNKTTNSLSLWLQMCGRGSRPYMGMLKKFFGVIDMGGNWKKLGLWETDRDWSSIFVNPDKPVEGGIGGVKECPECGCLIPVSSKVCKYCDAIVKETSSQLYDRVNLEFEVVSKMPVHINISELVEDAKRNERNNFYPLHQIKHRVISAYKTDTITDQIAYQLLDIYQTKVEEWCRLTKHDYDMFVKEKSGKWLLDELKAVYSWEPPKFTLTF